MRRNPRRSRTALAGAAAGILVLLTPGVAVADPLDDLVGSLEDTLQEAGAPAPGGEPDPAAEPRGEEAPEPASDDDLEGHETEDPKGPDHGGASAADADLGEQDVTEIGRTHAQTNDDDSTESDASLLSLGGQEVLGAHADSDGNQEEHFGDPLAPLCEGSDGQVCLAVLYADARATDDGSTSQSSSRTGVADACVGGSGGAGCDGPIALGAAQSSSESERDQDSGRTTASSESTVGAVCLSRDPVTGFCMVGAEALHSEGSADSGGSDGSGASAERDSYVLTLDLGGEERGRVEDPTAIALQPDCADPSLICVYLNQGETYLGEATAGHAQEALDLNALPGQPTAVGIELARTETLVHNDGGEDTGVAGDEATGDNRPPPALKGVGETAGNDGVVAGVMAGVLPDTGGIGTGLLAAGLLTLGGGALLLAQRRRRALAALAG